MPDLERRKPEAVLWEHCKLFIQDACPKSLAIDIEPSLEAAFKLQADAAGLTLEQFAHQLLERVADSSSTHHPRLTTAFRTIETLRGKLGPVHDNALSFDE